MTVRSSRAFDRDKIPRSPECTYESAYWCAGQPNVAGIDEAGRGAWAGPVCAGAVIFSPNPAICEAMPGVRDSKQMTPAQRAYWATEIQHKALAWGIGFASGDEITDLGIVPATRLAMLRAVTALNQIPDALLIDALPLPELSYPQTVLIKGDARAVSIAAASILAKTARDAYMVALGEAYPGYGFALHKGYGTALHQAALDHLGVCPEHRTSFAPIRRLLSADNKKD